MVHSTLFFLPLLLVSLVAWAPQSASSVINPRGPLESDAQFVFEQPETIKVHVEPIKAKGILAFGDQELSVPISAATQMSDGTDSDMVVFVLAQNGSLMLNFPYSWAKEENANVGRLSVSQISKKLLNKRVQVTYVRPSIRTKQYDMVRDEWIPCIPTNDGAVRDMTVQAAYAELKQDAGLILESGVIGKTHQTNVASQAIFDGFGYGLQRSFPSVEPIPGRYPKSLQAHYLSAKLDGEGLNAWLDNSNFVHPKPNGQSTREHPDLVVNIDDIHKATFQRIK